MIFTFYDIIRTFANDVFIKKNPQKIKFIFEEWFNNVYNAIHFHVSTFPPLSYSNVCANYEKLP